MEKQRRPIMVLSHEVRMICERLEKTSPGDIVTYEELGKLIKGDVRTRAKHKLRSACDRMLKAGAVFGAVTNVGIQRLTDEESVMTQASYLKRQRRAARRQTMRLTSVDYDQLPAAAKVAHNAALTTVAIMLHFSEKKQQSAITNKVTTENRTLAVGDLKSLFDGQ